METYHINFYNLHVDDTTKEMLIDTVRGLDQMSIEDLELQYYDDEV